MKKRILTLGVTVGIMVSAGMPVTANAAISTTQTLSTKPTEDNAFSKVVANSQEKVHIHKGLFLIPKPLKQLIPVLSRVTQTCGEQMDRQTPVGFCLRQHTQVVGE